MAKKNSSKTTGAMGDLFEQSPGAEQPGSEHSPIIMTASDEKLLAYGIQISTEPVKGNDMAFSHTVLCQVGLPRSKVDGRVFTRQTGEAWVSIQAGQLDEGTGGPVDQPLPYGVMPRLALAWISTYAKRHDTPEIPLGDSAAAFLRTLGLDNQGSRYATLRKQMHALAACRLQMGYKGRTVNVGEPIEQFDAWISNKEQLQRSLWPGVMTLSSKYFSELRDHAVPLDNRAMLALKGSALALDIYTWLAYRLRRINGRAVVLHWHNLREQFGQEYIGPNADKSFKKEFKKALAQVQTVYPKAQVNVVKTGISLLSSPPPVPTKD